jgi:deoxyribose-phosphate aldolase
MHELSKYIDHTILKPTCTNVEIEQLCKEAIAYQFKAVCVPPYYVGLASELLENTDVKVATVIGFPMGYSTIAAKVEEAKVVIKDGAFELDVVVNMAAVKSKRWNYVQNELDIMTTICHLHDRKIKIIFETGLLNEEEIKHLCEISKIIGADFVKTSTGINGGGATVDVVKLMRDNLPAHIQIKASGGIRTKEAAEAMIAAGATRIGTSSAITMIGSTPS